MVRQILDKLKKCIRHAKYSIDDREKNLRVLTHYGYTVLDQESILLQLEYKDFKKYDEDRDCPDEGYWFFKTQYDGRVFYVKFKIIFISEEFAFIKSLHIDGE